MRLDARNGAPDAYYRVYHAERCEILHTVQWVDDVMAQYVEFSSNGLSFCLVQAKKIVIYPSRMLIIINPVADPQDVEQKQEEVTA